MTDPTAPDGAPRKIEIFLDESGALGSDLGVQLIVQAPTGVVYGNQCGGHGCRYREAEGYLIPVAGPDAARELQSWFLGRMGSWCCDGRDDWTPETIAELRELVAALPFLRTWEGGTPRGSLELDEERLDECQEAWIPVRTPYGPGSLALANSD